MASIMTRNTEAGQRGLCDQVPRLNKFSGNLQVVEPGESVWENVSMGLDIEKEGNGNGNEGKFSKEEMSDAGVSN